MSNAIIVPDTFKGPVASVFQGQQSTDDLSGGVSGGYGLIKYRGKVWSIYHNGNTVNLMREDGDGPRGSIDVVIVKANPVLSKTWYENGWDESSNNPPDCASANGIVPDQGVPKKQSNVCATCPRNAWGSAPNGGKGKACGDHRRMAVVPKDDILNEALGGALLLRCPAASLQDLAAFEARYKQMGYPYFTMAIKIGFDPAESYPKFTFAAIRPLTDEEGKLVLAMRDSPEVARVINEGTAPAPAAQLPQGEQPAFLEAPTAQQAAVAAATQQVQVQPAPAPAPAPAQPQPAVAAAAQPSVAAAPNGAGVAGAPATGGSTGFGPTSAAPAPAAVAPAAAPQATRAQVAMTGFGAVAPAESAQPAQAAQTVTPQVTQPAGPAATPAPAVVSAFEGSIDDRLNALLASNS